MHYLVLSGLLVLPSAALPRLDLNRVQPADAARAIAAAHPELADAPIDLPAEAYAHGAAPELQAGPVEHWPGSAETAHIRIRCASDAVCRPFYATVHLPAAVSEASKWAGSPAGQEKSRQPAPPAASDGLRPGAHAALLIDSGRIHLRIPVTCLSGGTPGAPIRVAGPKNARIYQATVVDGATVRGVL